MHRRFGFFHDYVVGTMKGMEGDDASSHSKVNERYSGT
jgi:hypothetical protein